MKEIIIEPHIGIGQLKLGMTSDELENALLQMKKQWSNSSDEAMQMECCAETDDPNLITGRYMDNDSFFLVQYRNGKAAEIGIQRDLSKVASIKLFGMDMFNTAAECIIDSLMSIAKQDNYKKERAVSVLSFHFSDFGMRGYISMMKPSGLFLRFSFSFW